MSEAFKLEHYKSNSVSDLIHSVVHKVKKQSDIKQIRYMQMFYGNHYIEGVPFDITESRGTSYVSVYFYSQHMAEPEIIVLPINGIASVRLPFHDFYKDVIMKPGPWTQDLTDAPSRLSVERKGAELTTAWNKAVQVQWNGSEQDPAARIYVHKLVTTTEKLMGDLLKDSMGAESLNTIKTIQFCFQSSESLAVSQHSDTLKIMIGTSANLNRLESDLNAELNKAL